MGPARAGQFIAGYGRWQFGIGDRNPVAWATVVAYLVAAALAVGAAFAAGAVRQRVAPADPREARNQASVRRLWLLIATTMLILGINKQLDLQSLVLQVVRERAVAGGWYDDRRGYQTEFIVAMAGLGLFATILLAVAMRHVLRRVLIPVVGLGLLVSFVVIRAASFHNVDKVLALQLPIRVNWMIEFAGIGLIAVAAVHFRWAERRRSPAATAVAGQPEAVQPSSTPEPVEL